MNTWANTVLTDKGRSLLAKLTQGNTLNITRAETGAGFVTTGMLTKQTAVADPKHTPSFRSVTYPEVGKCAIPVVLKNDGLSTGYKVTQVGIYATDPDEGEILLFLSQAQDAESGVIVPSETEMPGFSSEWTFYLQYGQADSVNVTVDPSNTVSWTEMESYFEDAKAELNGVYIIGVTGDGTTYTGTAPGIETLKKGLTITIIPDATSATSIPKLNLNGLGSKSIKQKLSVNNALTVAAATDAWMVANKPITLQFDGTQWVTMAPRSSADDIYGKVAVSSGGTGRDSVTAGSFLVGNGTDAMVEKNPVEVLEYIGAAASSHFHRADNVTSGTFAGQVCAGRATNYQDSNTYLLRNSKLSSTESNPTNDGEICWTYK